MVADAQPEHTLKALHDFLVNSYSVDELGFLIAYDNRFVGLRNEFGPNDSIAVRVNKTIEYCRRRRLLDQFLVLVEQDRSGRLTELGVKARSKAGPEDARSQPTGRPAPAAVLAPNPFTERMAIRDPERFVGRERVLEQVGRMLERGSVALVGGRKIGKTSILYRLRERLCQDGETAIFWDFHDLARMPKLVNEWLRALGSGGESWSDFRGAVEGRQVVLLLDELELAPERGFDVDWLGACRSLVQRERGVRFVTSSNLTPRQIFPSRPGSFPHDFLMVVEVKAFQPEEARRLLTHPWDREAPQFDRSTVEELIALTGGQPFRLQRAAHHCYEALTHPAYDWQAAYLREMEALA